MAKKRAAIGFRSLVLAPVMENTLTSYKTKEGEPLPFAGSMTRTAKESKVETFYDDDDYVHITTIVGEEVEVRVAEMDLERMACLGLGEWNEETQTLEADFSASGKEFALRCVIDTAGSLPYYFNFRNFELHNIRFDNFVTRKDNVTICEVILTGIVKRPKLSGLKPWAVMRLKEDRSNEAACIDYLMAAETKVA